MEKILCLRCQDELVEAFLNTGSGTLILQTLKKKIFDSSSSITAYVCKNCGHIELIADNPDIFRKLHKQ